jgi:signal transduction histidine kinase
VLRRVTSDVEAPVAFCSASGLLELASPAGIAQLQRVGVATDVPTPLPDTLWQALSRAPLGQAVEWCIDESSSLALECTRYGVREGGFVLWLRTVIDRHAGLPESLQCFRQEPTGRMIASIARELRGSVASIVYSADFLESRGQETPHETVRQMVHEISDAGRRLQLTVDGLLDYARLGPAISVPVSLHEILNRAQGMLRSYYREGARRVRVELTAGADWVRGNPVVVEQLFVNLLLSFAESEEATRSVSISTALGAGGSLVAVQVQLSSDGSDSPRSTTMLSAAARTATRLAVLDARKAAESQGGHVVIEGSTQTPSFLVSLPRSEGPR